MLNTKPTLLIGVLLLAASTTGCTGRMAVAGAVGAVVGAAVVASSMDDGHDHCGRHCNVRRHRHHRRCEAEPATEYEVIYVTEE